MAIFKGAGVAIVTPMYEDGKVNFEQLEHIVDWQIENGTDAIIICGTTGESSTLSEPEHVECIKVAVAEMCIRDRSERMRQRSLICFPVIRSRRIGTSLWWLPCG